MSYETNNKRTFYECDARACAQAQTACKRKRVREGACERVAASKRSIRLWASGPLKSVRLWSLIVNRMSEFREAE